MQYFVLAHSDELSSLWLVDHCAMHALDTELLFQVWLFFAVDEGDRHWVVFELFQEFSILFFCVAHLQEENETQV